jgi:E3 ubiquitin-protein ligase SIAH1
MSQIEEKNDNSKPAESILEAYICKECGLYALPPIYQCKEGHIFCDTCRGAIKICKVCGKGEIDNKNDALEAIAEFLRFPCVNHKEGCLAVFGHILKRKHEESKLISFKFV